MFVTGGRIGADQALAWGLVNKVAAADDLIAAAIRMARGLAR
jgi:enoyl-CoA hydratase/carnithine racemase